MNKKQNPTTLKLHKVDGDRIVSNHNETSLKMGKGTELNHNKTVMKVRKVDGDRIVSNHSETALKMRKHGPIGSNHNETALRSK